MTGTPAGLTRLGEFRYGSRMAPLRNPLSIGRVSAGIAVLALCSLLTGCASATDTSPGGGGLPATSNRSSTVAEDQELFDLLEPTYPATVGTEKMRSMAVEVALQGCDALDDGVSTDSLFENIREGSDLADEVTSNAVATVVAGIRAYCPEYQTEMIATVDSF